jgi:hypothetical protein
LPEAPAICLGFVLFNGMSETLTVIRSTKEIYHDSQNLHPDVNGFSDHKRCIRGDILSRVAVDGQPAIDRPE